MFDSPTITQINKPSKIQSVISRKEAELSLADLNAAELLSVQASAQQNSIGHESPSLRREMTYELTRLLAAYETGEVEYCSKFANLGHLQSTTDSVTLVNELNSAIFQAEIIYSTKKIKEPAEFKNHDSISISKMDDKALTRETPFGSINPPMAGILFIDEELRTPSPKGFIRNLGYADFYPSSKPEEFINPEINLAKPVFNIEYPREAGFVPMPLKAELTELNLMSGTKIAKPSPSDPLAWRIRPYQELGKYQIQETDKEDLLKVALNQNIYPSKAEQEYWKSVLPLPQDLEKRIEESPKDLIHFISSYLGIRQGENLSNFRYVCNPYLSSFLEKHKENLPLITNELKVGHCDLLSWYVAAQLRAHGKPAWVSGVSVTSKDGKSFNAAYKHSVVITTDEQGKLLQYDPTVHTDYDSAYHPEIMDQAKINELDRDFSQAKTIKTKLKALRKFIAQVPELRRKAGNNDKVQNYLQELNGSFLSSLMSNEREFSQAGNSIRGQVADWSELPQDSSLEAISDLVESLSFALKENKSFQSISFNNLNTKHIRAKFAQLMKNLQDQQIFFGCEIIGNIDLLRSLRTSNFDPKNLSSYIEEEIENKNIMADNYFLPSPELASILDKDSIMGFMQYKRSNPIKYVSLGSLYEYKLSSNKFKDFQYSELFKKLLGVKVLITDFAMDDKKILTIGFDDTLKTEFSYQELVKNAFDLRYQYGIFVNEFQRASIDSNYRKDFLEKINQDENWFRDMACIILGIDRTKPKNIIGELPRLNKIIPLKTEDDNVYPFKLEQSDNQRLIAEFTKAIKRIDINQSSGRTVINEDQRAYFPGDDTRMVDWRSYGRSDHLYVKQSPYHAIDISTPLHVVIDVNHLGRTPSVIQTIELIRTLQIESQKTHREVYLSFNNSKSYFKLSSRESPRMIYEALGDYSKSCSSEKEYSGALISDQSGKTNCTYIDGKQVKMPQNLLFVSDSYSKISSAQYLFSKHPKSTIETIYLHDEPYKIYPLVEDEWVENGFKEIDSSKN